MALPPQPDSAPAAEATMVAPALPALPAPTALPAPAAPAARSWRGMVLTGGFVGMVAGLAAGYDHFRKQPAEYASNAVVSGRDHGAVIAPAVLDRAARRLDAMGPFAPPLPTTTSERVAYLKDHVSIEARDGTFRVVFRGPNPADTVKYLRAVTDAYVAEGTPRPQPAPPLPPTPGAPPTAPSPTPVNNDARTAAERQKFERELAAVTSEPLTAVEARVTQNKTALAVTQGKLRDTDRDLKAIDAAGTDPARRAALMTQFGVRPDAVAPVAPTAEEKEYARLLVDFQRKKVELGRRLGAEHRDMVALDEQIRFTRDLLVKAAPPKPAADALDRHKEVLTTRWAMLNADASDRAELLQRDEATLAAAAPIRAKIDLLAGRPPAPQPFPVTQPQTQPPFMGVPDPTPAAVAAGPEVVSSPAEGERVSPLLAASLLPGGAIGLAGGLVLGYLASLLTGALATRPKREPKAKAPPKPVVLSGTVRRTGLTRVVKYDGPPLGVPVLGQIPTLRLDLPVEKKSVEGWSPALVSYTRPNGAEAEAYRAARRALIESLGSAGHKAVVVTSPGDGDGKTTTAANLALSLAQSGKRVLLIDCDYRGTKQQELFRLGRLGDSLKSVLTSDVDLRVAVRTCDVPNFYILPAGRAPVDSADVLTRAKFKDLVAELKAQYEYVILDAPPTTAEKELKALAEQADGMLLVVRGGSDATARAATATSEVARAGSRVLGAVVTAAPARPAAPQGDPAAATAV